MIVNIIKRQFKPSTKNAFNAISKTFSLVQISINDLIISKIITQERNNHEIVTETYFCSIQLKLFNYITKQCFSGKSMYTGYIKQNDYLYCNAICFFTSSYSVRIIIINPFPKTNFTVITTGYQKSKVYSTLFIYAFAQWC